MNVNRILQHIINIPAINNVILEKFKFTTREDAIIQTYNELINENAVIPLVPESPVECLKLTLTHESTSYAAQNLNKFSYANLCTLVQLYQKSSINDSVLDSALYQKLYQSGLAPLVLITLLSKKFTETTLDCVMLYAELIKSQSICRRVLMCFKSQYLKKYQILLMNSPIMRIEFQNYLCSLDFLRLKSSIQQKLFKLSFQIIQVINLTETSESFIVNIFRQNLNINECVYRGFLTIVYLLIKNNFVDNDLVIIRIVQSITHSVILNKNVKYQTMVLNMYVQIYKLAKYQFDKHNMLYHVLLLTCNINPEVQIECFQILNNFIEFSQEQFDTFFYMINAIKTPKVLQLSSQILVTILKHDFKWIYQLLETAMTLNPESRYYVLSSILMVTNLQSVKSESREMLTLLINQLIQDVSNEQCGSQFTRQQLIVLFLLLADCAPAQYDYYNSIMNSYKHFKSSEYFEQELILFCYFNAICPQQSKIPLTSVTLDLRPHFVLRNFKFEDFEDFDLKPYETFAPNQQIIDQLIRYIEQSQHQYQLLQSLLHLLQALLQREQFYRDVLISFTIQLVQKDFLGQFALFAPLFTQLDQVPYELFDFCVKNAHFHFIQQLIEKPFVQKNRSVESFISETAYKYNFGFVSAFKTSKQTTVLLQFENGTITIMLQNKQLSIQFRGQLFQVIVDEEQFFAGFQIKYVNQKQITSIYINNRIIQSYQTEFAQGTVKISSNSSETRMHGEEYYNLYLKIASLEYNTKMVLETDISKKIYVLLFENSDKNLIKLFGKILQLRLERENVSELDVTQLCTVKEVFQDFLEQLNMSDCLDITDPNPDTYIVTVYVQIKYFVILFQAIIKNLTRYTLTAQELINLLVICDKIQQIDAFNRVFADAKLTNMDNYKYIIIFQLESCQEISNEQVDQCMQHFEQLQKDTQIYLLQNENIVSRSMHMLMLKQIFKQQNALIYSSTYLFSQNQIQMMLQSFFKQQDPVLLSQYDKVFDNTDWLNGFEVAAVDQLQQPFYQFIYNQIQSQNIQGQHLQIILNRSNKIQNICCVLHGIVDKIAKNQDFNRFTNHINQFITKIEFDTQVLDSVKLPQTCFLLTILKYGQIMHTDEQIWQRINNILFHLFKQDIFLQRVCFSQLNAKQVELLLLKYIDSIPIGTMNRQIIQQISMYLVNYEIKNEEIWDYFVDKRVVDQLIVKYHYVNQTRTGKFINDAMTQFFDFSEDEKLFISSDYDNTQQKSEKIRKNFQQLLCYVIREFDFDLDLPIVKLAQNYVQQLQFPSSILEDDMKLELTNLGIQTQQELSYIEELMQNLTQQPRTPPTKKEANCQYCGTSVPEINYQMQQKLKLVCHICQTDVTMLPLDNCMYLAKRRIQLDSVLTYHGLQTAISSHVSYPARKCRIDKIKLKRINPLTFYTKYNKTSQTLTEVLLMDPFAPFTCHFGVNEEGIQLIKSAIKFEGLMWLLGQIQPKFQQFKYDQNGLNSEHEVEMRYGVYDNVQAQPPKQYINILFENIRLIYKSKLANFFWVLEFVMTDSTSHYVIFETQKECDKLFYNQYFQIYNSSQQIQIIPLDASSQQVKQAIKLFKQNEISTYALIITLNYLSMRSFNNLFQYPIFPFVQNSRDLKLVIGAQNPEQLQKQLQRQAEFNEHSEDKVSVFQTFFSHRAVAAHYLVKFEPFTSIQRLLQNGIYDAVDRQFQNLKKQWDKVFAGQSFSELIPELFTVKDLYSVAEEFILSRQMLENIDLSDWCQMVFGGSMEDNTYPKYTENQEYTSIQDSGVLKSLFYGTMPLQLNQKFALDRKQVDIKFSALLFLYQLDQLKLSAHYICPELPVPYFNVQYAMNGVISDADVVIDKYELRLKNQNLEISQICKCTDVGRLKLVQQSQLMCQYTFQENYTSMHELYHSTKVFSAILCGPKSSLLIVSDYRQIIFRQLFSYTPQMLQVSIPLQIITFVQSGYLYVFEIAHRHFSDQQFIQKFEVELIFKSMVKLPQHSMIQCLQINDGNAQISILYKFYVNSSMKNALIEYDLNMKIIRQKQFEQNLKYIRPIQYQDQSKWTLIADDDQIYVLNELFAAEKTIKFDHLTKAEQIDNFVFLISGEKEKYSVFEVEMW
ncbi:Beige/BEACH_domain-containing protein [Hexamita inflata]|uniref:Beige/BEACH domain-containing protein n=1 Tax=Hexamita inflata TaxID=28002 RepID=A0AA86TPX6_9EUKA|nr:Beige/BEACH domain-containing protein [Hexamita inflata]